MKSKLLKPAIQLVTLYNHKMEISMPVQEMGFSDYDLTEELSTEFSKILIIVIMVIISRDLMTVEGCILAAIPRLPVLILLGINFGRGPARLVE